MSDAICSMNNATEGRAQHPPKPGSFSPLQVPVWEKYTLTIEEAAAYFRIGENKLRKLIAENRDAAFILWNGTRPQIKRKLFEQFVDRTNAI